MKFGITTVHDAGSSFALAQKLRAFAEAGQLPVRMLVMIRAGSRELEGRLSHVLESWESSPRCKPIIAPATLPLSRCD